MRILIEMYNATLRSGTGIATYSRALHKTIKSMGCEAEGLLHVNVPIHSKDSAAAEIAVFDTQANAGKFFGAKQIRMIDQLFGAPFGIKLTKLNAKERTLDGDTWRSILGELKECYVASRYDARARCHFRRYGTAAQLVISNPPQIFHATHLTPLRIVGAKNVYTIHDVVPLRMPQTTLDDKIYYRQLLKYICRTADRIVTVSEASRRDIIELGGADPEKVINTYQSVYFDPKQTAAGDDEIGAMVNGSFGLRFREYFLFYGAIEPKKNISRLIDAYLASNSKHPLVIAGGLGWQYEDDVRKIRENRLRGYLFDGRRISEDRRIIRLPYLSGFSLTNLIRGARAVLFPSLYEGFGLPVLESMYLGTPVVTSNNTSMLEIAGNAAVLVNPLDIADIMRGIRLVDESDEVRRDLISRGRQQAIKFSVEAYAKRLELLYSKLIT